MNTRKIMNTEEREGITMYILLHKEVRQSQFNGSDETKKALYAKLLQKYQTISTIANPLPSVYLLEKRTICALSYRIRSEKSFSAFLPKGGLTQTFF